MELEPKPNDKSASAAVAALQSQLEMADGNVDALDRKAALIPATLAALAGLLLANQVGLSGWQLAAIAVALVTGITSAILALLALQARKLVLGPIPSQVAAGVGLPIAEFNQRLAGSIAIAIDTHTDLAEKKGRMINWAMRFAVASIVCLAVSRVIGGFQVSDTQQPGAAPSSSPPAQQPVQTPATTPIPSVQPTVDPSVSPAANLPNFGANWAQKSGLPPNTETRFKKG